MRLGGQALRVLAGAENKNAEPLNGLPQIRQSEFCSVVFIVEPSCEQEATRRKSNTRQAHSSDSVAGKAAGPVVRLLSSGAMVH